MTNASIELLDESSRWHAREVRYLGGSIESILGELPEFELRPFQSDADAPANPFLKVVMRLPRTRLERPMPVGVVSNRYTLAGHRLVTEKCLQAIRDQGISTAALRAELGITELGEWMNLRLYFPDAYTKQVRGQDKVSLRLECFNSVDGSSRLVVLLGWIRFVCANGLIVGETKAELRDVHDARLNLEHIGAAIGNGLKMVERDFRRMQSWAERPVSDEALVSWVDGPLSEEWGKKAASRVFHICKTGEDSDLVDPFARGSASQKPVRTTVPVPGSDVPAKDLYAVSQALSWVGTRRNNAEERVAWLSQIPDLLARLAKSDSIAGQA